MDSECPQKNECQDWRVNQRLFGDGNQLSVLISRFHFYIVPILKVVQEIGSMRL